MFRPPFSKLPLIIVALALAACVSGSTAGTPPQDSASHLLPIVRIFCSPPSGPDHPLIYIALTPEENPADHCPPGSTFVGTAKVPRVDNIPPPPVPATGHGGPN